MGTGLHEYLGEGGGIAGLVDIILAVKQSVSEVLQLESSIVVSPARTGELRLVTTTEVHQSPSCRSKDSFLARLVTPPLTLFFLPILLFFLSPFALAFPPFLCSFLLL